MTPRPCAAAQLRDLAHGSKTPLAVLGAVAKQARHDDRKDIADPIDEQTLRMTSRLTACSLAPAFRLLWSHSSIPFAPVADKIIRALRRLPDDRSLQWDCDISAEVNFPGDEGDITEILANLLDNARKWAATRVRLTVMPGDDHTEMRVEDDGPACRPSRCKRLGADTAGTKRCLAPALASPSHATLRRLIGDGSNSSARRLEVSASQSSYRDRPDSDRAKKKGEPLRKALPWSDRSSRAGRHVSTLRPTSPPLPAR